MNTHDSQLKNRLESLNEVRLSASSRERLATDLKAYAAFHPVREAGQGRFKMQVPFIGPVITLITQPKHFMPALLITFVLLAGGGTSLAAQNAVPGEILYPIKIDVNEKIVSALTVGAEAEASLHAKLAKERLEEAEELAAEGKLSAEFAQALAVNLKEHSDQAEALSAKLEARGDLKTAGNVRSTIEGTFRSYADVLSGLNIGVSGNNGISLISDIRTYLNANTDNKATTTTELSADLSASIEGTIDYADTAIARASVSLEAAESNVSAGAYAELEKKLNAAITAHTAAKAAFATNQYTNAYAEARTAIRLATQVQTKATSMSHLKLRVEAAGLNLDTLLETKATTSAEVEEEKPGNRNNVRTTSDETSTRPEKSEEQKQKVEIESGTSVEAETEDTQVNFNQSLRSTLGL